MNWLLCYVATVVVVLGFVDGALFGVESTTPVPGWLVVLAIAGAGLYVLFTFALPVMVGMDVRRVLPPPGPVLATRRVVGHLGWLRFRGLAVTVEVYEDRLTLKPTFMPTCVIHGSDIQSIGRARGRRPLMVIEHTAPGRMSPVRLYALPEHVREQIKQIRRDPADLPVAERIDERAFRRLTMFICAMGLVLGLTVLTIGSVRSPVQGPGQLVVGIVLTFIAFVVGVGLYRRLFRPT